MSYCLTFTHCFLCYKETEDETKKKRVVEDSKSFFELYKNKELCKRFCTVASRFLNMDKHYFKPEKTLNSKRSINLQTLCTTCDEMVASFCDVYEQLEHLQLQLDWKVREITKVMQYSDVDPSYAPFRQQLETKMENTGGSIEELDDFRREFYCAARDREKEIFPRVCVPQYKPVPKPKPPHNSKPKSKTSYKKNEFKSFTNGSGKLKADGNKHEVRKQRVSRRDSPDMSDSEESLWSGSRSTDLVVGSDPIYKSLSRRKRRKLKRDSKNYNCHLLTDNEESRTKNAKYRVKSRKV